MEKEIGCLIAKQGDRELICFSMKAKELWKIVQINKREPDKNVGYQRVLSVSRVASISKYLDSGNQIPTCILISLDAPVKLTDDKSKIVIPDDQNVGWVIDGQHRLAGANNSTVDVEFFVIAFLNLPIEEQVRQFVTINNESKGVPTSLIYDLLMYLPPNKTSTEIAQEQATEIANDFRKDESSPFYGKIAIIHSPKKGEISLTNFVRKVSGYIIKDRGKFNKYSLNEQKKIFDNYFKAIVHTFPELSDPSNSIFFQTIGFGAMMQALDAVFDYTMLYEKGFSVTDIVKILRLVSDFQFSDWKKYGTGSSAEIQAGNDFKVSLELRIKEDKQGSETRIRL